MQHIQTGIQDSWQGIQAWISVWQVMVRKEFTIMTRYPVEFAASFLQMFLIVAVLTLATTMFTAPDALSRGQNDAEAGLFVYGLILYMFLSDTLWTIGYNVRREQKQGTLEQLYLSPAAKSAHLISRVTITLFWTGLLTAAAAILMIGLIGTWEVHNLVPGLVVLALTLSGTFGFGFAYAALTLRIRETAQTLASSLQFVFIVLCAPFFPFSSLPEGVQLVSRLVPISYGVDLFRTTLMGYPAGFPELAPLWLGWGVVLAFGTLMPPLGLWLYHREEDRARRRGSLSEY